MPRGRALRILNVNPDTMQKSVDLKTLNSAFSCTENDIPGNKCMLERSLKNAQLLKENKLVKELEQELQAASTSKLDPPLGSQENPESTSIGRAEQPEDDDNFPPTGLFCSSSGVPESSHTTALVENAVTVSGSLASNNIVADLHEKLCSSRVQNKNRANGELSQSSDTDDNLPLLNTIVNEILSLEVDFPIPSTSSADTYNNRSSAEWKKRCKKQYTRTAPTRGKRQRKVNENLALASSIPITVVDNTSSTATPVISDSDSDSDCEITGYVPSNSQQIVSSEIDSRNATELNLCDQSILELDTIPVPLVSDQNSEDACGTNMRLDSIINMLNGTIQRGEDDDILVLDTLPQTGVFEYGTNLNRSVVEIGSTSVNRQKTPPVIVVSDDESEPSVTPALNKKLKPAAIGSQQTVTSRNGRMWECPICWEELTSVRGVSSTMCGHVFCNPCISNVLETTRKCPMCRKSLNKKKVHPLFLDG